MSLPPLHSDSSSTKENRDRDEARTTENDKANSVKQKYYRTPQHIAISQSETILLSSSGDVLVSRCRTSPYPQTTRNPYQWQNDIAVMCCDVQCEDLSRQLQESSLMCSPWSTVDKQDGLLGGAPAAQVAPSPEHVQQHNQKNGYHKHDKHQQSNGPRLRGGASAGKSSSDATKDAKSASSEDGSRQSLRNRAQKAFRTVPLVDTGFDQDEDSIVPIRSFDYSHFNEGGNDMLPPFNTVSESPERKEHKVTSPRTTPMSVFLERPPLHGIPSFVPAFAQIKVTKLSAHPLGSHVLLISNAGLLYSYGLNTYGQLGIGLSSHSHGPHRGYFAAPTIVTPLVENGGKAIACAAGVTHSLVVIVTEEQRLVKSRSMNQLSSSSSKLDQQHRQNSRSSNDSAVESVVHHQLYGFGRNDYMKLGLVTPKLAPSNVNGTKDEMEQVVLPRRVALRAKVRPNDSHWPSDYHNKNGDDDDEKTTTPPPGIFAVEASAEHSAALVRRASGDVELYTWGNAMHGALGVIPNSGSTSNVDVPTPVLSNGSANQNKGQLIPAPTTFGVVPVPSFVATLSRTSNPRARSSSLLLRGEYPTSISLGYRCSFVTTSQGRCFSFGVDEHGMLGLGKCIRECSIPSEIPLPPDARHEKIVSVRTGASSVLATTRSGSVLAWGTKKHVGLAVGSASVEEHHEPTTITGSWEERSSHKVEDHIQWSPKRIILTDDECQDGDNGIGSNVKIVEAAAGYDNAVFLTESGRVLSCGTASGRLGLGEVQEDVTAPQPMFGGLKLWHQPKTKNPSRSSTMRYPSIPRPRNKTFHRGKTVA